MRFFAGLIFGFIAGTFYALYQSVEASESKLINIMESLKAIMGVF
ncbi:hypothetical protein [Oceanobacillus sp. Castelsardo]|nr:hypothetical protein [Oceanobacillus sp. Castelsardo]